MKTKRIGSLEVSIVGLGTNNFGTPFFGQACDQKVATAIVHAALDAGVTFFDTAEEYSARTKWGVGCSEDFIRAALGSRRNEIVIATKFMIDDWESPGEIGAKRIMKAVEGSLRRLGTDRIDLYQQHFPDPRVPIAEILEALDRLVKDGKVREIGNSNFSGAMIDDANAAAEARGFRSFVAAQNQYNLLDPPVEEGVLASCERNGLKLLPFFPLASGLLTGKYKRDTANPAGSRFAGDTVITNRLRERQMSDERIAKVERLQAFAEARGHTIVELAISWLTSQPIVASVIAGATKPEQITANARAAAWQLTDEDFRAVTAIAREPAGPPGAQASG
jgi:aryl-alcohol dehydrogenase-like predicted oxidoreductase